MEAQFLPSGIRCPKCESVFVYEATGGEGSAFLVCLYPSCENYRKTFVPVLPTISLYELGSEPIKPFSDKLRDYVEAGIELRMFRLDSDDNPVEERKRVEAACAALFGECRHQH